MPCDHDVVQLAKEGAFSSFQGLFEDLEGAPFVKEGWCYKLALMGTSREVV